MNRRITKSMAEKAAAIMKRKAYGPKIEKAKAKVDAEVEKLVRKYVPAPIIACVNEYPVYFNYTTGVSISTVIDKGKNTSLEHPILGALSFKVPYNGNYIKVENSEYNTLLILDKKRLQLEKERDEFGEQIRLALVSLGTEKAVERELPEAMKYLIFPEVKAVPMPIFTGLRDIIAKIEKEQ